MLQAEMPFKTSIHICLLSVDQHHMIALAFCKVGCLQAMAAVRQACHHDQVFRGSKGTVMACATRSQHAGPLLLSHAACNFWWSANYNIVMSS